MPDPLSSPAAYQAFIYALPSRYPSIRRSTLVYVSSKEKLYWYDSVPHPHDLSLASTDPHHKHVPPDIKRQRVPAPELSFTRSNLPFLIAEIERTVLPSAPQGNS
ncbi:MAG: hypothetical protein CVU38_21435 [Chloroflexi bacterium HGW-Chloroflexi-1]|nr:MAG: hypothetical protein CVU38_21435 [Chloroflexi bacterium HGW-Chloroflexi-1]